MLTLDLGMRNSVSAAGVDDEGNVTWWFIREGPAAGVEEEDDVFVVLEWLADA